MWKFALTLTLFAIFSASFADVTDKETLANLTRTVGDYLKKLEGKGKLELIEINSATHQTVAGSKYEMSAKVMENDVPVNCTISILEKPWIPQYVEFNVECGPAPRTYTYESSCDPYSFSFMFNGKRPMFEGDALSYFIPKLNNITDDIAPDFNYTFNRVIMGQTEVWQDGTNYSRLLVEVTPKDHVNQTVECGIIMYEHTKVDLKEYHLNCENDWRRYEYANE